MQPHISGGGLSLILLMNHFDVVRVFLFISSADFQCIVPASIINQNKLDISSKIKGLPDYRVKSFMDVIFCIITWNNYGNQFVAGFQIIGIIF